MSNISYDVNGNFRKFYAQIISLQYKNGSFISISCVLKHNFKDGAYVYVALYFCYYTLKFVSCHYKREANNTQGLLKLVSRKQTDKMP